MNNKLTLTEFLAKRICESNSQNITEDFAEEIATTIHEEYQDEMEMTNDEWDKFNTALVKFIEDELLEDAEKLAEEWTEDNEEWAKEREEASRGQY